MGRGRSGATAPPASALIHQKSNNSIEIQSPGKGKLTPSGSERDQNVTGHNYCKILKYNRFGFCERHERDHFAVSMSEDLSEKAEFINEKQLLARLPISRRTLGNWKAKGMLPFIKIGRRCLYDWASVRGAMLRRQRGGS
jgi:hypothetical protein